MPRLRCATTRLFAIGLLLLLPCSAAALGVSPLLVDAAVEVYGLIARPDNPVWPGWNASDTPLLLYLPGEQDLLIGHPAPPVGFAPYDGPLHFPGASMLVKNGATILSHDGQNTAMDVNGVRTLVVADPLSNLRSNIGGLLGDPRPTAEKARTLEFSTLVTDPYDQLALITHEAFHVYQERTAPNRGANEMLLLRYPVLSVDNNVGFGLEAAALADALAASDDATFRAAALRWLAAREHRRALLPLSALQYEDGVEFSEGLAKYTEYRLFTVLEGRAHGAGLDHAQGFHGYHDLSTERRSLLRQMQRHMRGEVNVNNAPYGTAPLRMRLYYSGMAMGVLLDRLSSTWKRDVMTTDSSLTALARAAVHATPEELSQAWEQSRSDTSYRSLAAAKQRLHDAGEHDALARLAAIEHGPGTGVVVDYSKLGSRRVSLSFTPFGITVIDSVRTIFDQVPISGGFIDGSKFAQMFPLPLLQDKHHGLVRCRLERTLSRGELERLAGAGRLGSTKPAPLKLELPGLTLDLKHATLDMRDGVVRVVVLPASTARPGSPG